MRRRSTHVIVRSHHPRLRQSALAALALVLIAVGWLLYEYGRSSAGFSIVESMRRELEFKGRVSGLEAENGRLKGQVTVLEQGAEIDRRAYEEVERMMTELQNEVLELRQEVAFYRGIVNSEDVAPGLRIQSFKVRRDEQEQYHYRLVLTQLASTIARIQGQAQISLAGMLDGAQVELSSQDVLADSGARALRFSFRNFQELRGSLTLPPGFIPLRITLKAAPQGGGTVVERTFSWNEALS